MRALLSSSLPDGFSDLCSVAVVLHATAVCVRMLRWPSYGAQIELQEASQALTAIDKGLSGHALQTCRAAGRHFASLHVCNHSRTEFELTCEEQSSTQSTPVEWCR